MLQRGLSIGSAAGTLVFVLVVGCATKHINFDYANEPDPRKREYVIGPSDVLKVNVWRNAEISSEAVVRPDGTFSMPLVGDVRAAGRTPEQVRNEISQRLATFIKDESALVTLTVVAIHSYRFTISGNVEKPGEYTPAHYVTVSEAIALAGGPNKFAVADEAVIIRVDPAKGVRRIPIDYPAIMTGTHPEQDLPVVAGDGIYIP